MPIITASAHKLAGFIYLMLNKQQGYNEDCRIGQQLRLDGCFPSEYSQLLADFIAQMRDQFILNHVLALQKVFI